MIRRIQGLVVCLFVFITSASIAVEPQTGVKSFFTAPHLERQLLIKHTTAITPNGVASLLAPFGALVTDSDDAAQLVLVTIDDDNNLEAASTLVTADNRITYAEPNFVYAIDVRPNDLDFARQWAKENTGFNAPGVGVAGADLNLVQAWDTKSIANDVVLAIIDDSFEITHVDLAANFIGTGRCFASPQSHRPCVNGPDDASPSDPSDFHGTPVTGTAAARGNNAVGIVGSAWETRVLPIKVDLTALAIARAVDDAIASNANVINMSFGGPSASSAMREAIERAEVAGVLVVVAAGNADANNSNASVYPANFAAPNVITAAASNASDFASSFSQWGGVSVDLAAPGEQVLTTSEGNSFNRFNGTSFAAPHIAGIAALVHSHIGASNYRQTKAHLLYGGVNGESALGPVTPGTNKQQIPGRTAAGRLDAARALSGPSAAVILIDSVVVDDAITGNGNGVLEPGETASLAITLHNHWLPAAEVSASLVSADSALINVNDVSPVVYGNIAQDQSVTKKFSVSLSASATGNQQTFFTLDITDTSPVVLPARYFYLETGTLQSGVELTQAIQRWNWDEFQAFQIEVPAGANELSLSTSGSGDVDLLVRYEAPPEYLITLNAQGTSGFYYTDSDTLVSGGAGANENISVNNPLPGTWHVVVVNYDQSAKNYTISAEHSSSAIDAVAFTSSSLNVAENDAQVALTVNRSGGLGPASVDYSTATGSATTADFVPASGTLTWLAGETGDKIVVVELVDDASPEATENFAVNLFNATGITMGTPSTVTVTINDDDGGSAVFFSTNNITIDEATPLVSITIHRTSGASGSASVDYMTVDGSATSDNDYSETTGTLTWAEGDQTARSVDVTILDDAFVEGTETFSVVLQNAVNTSIQGASSIEISITNDDSSVLPQPVARRGSGGVGLSAILVMLLCLRRRYTGVSTQEALHKHLA